MPKKKKQYELRKPSTMAGIAQAIVGVEAPPRKKEVSTREDFPLAASHKRTKIAPEDVQSDWGGQGSPRNLVFYPEEKKASPRDFHNLPGTAKKKR